MNEENAVVLLRLLKKIVTLKEQIREVRKEITKLRKAEEKQLLTDIAKKGEKN